MQCSTSKAARASWETKTVPPTSSWEALFAQLPPDFEERARTSGALVRRRGIHNARDLLQVILAYAVGDWSLRQVGAWGTVSGVAEVSDVTVLNRLRQSVNWLEGLVVHQLTRRLPSATPAAVRLRLLDATVLARPGSKSSDWRIHLSFDLAEWQADSLTLTTTRTGEGLQHFTFAPGEIVVADRAYGYPKKLTALLATGASCVVRCRWTDLAEYTHQGQPFALLAWLRSTFRPAGAQTQAIDLQLTTASGTWPLRLVVAQLPAAEAAQARRRLRRKRQQKGETPSAETLYGAGFVLLLTNLPTQQGSAAQVCQLYRYRWQIELYFKRLKSILHLDRLRARDPQLARAYLLAKLLAALLLDTLAHTFLAPVPTWSDDLTRPLSLWRLTTLLWLSLQIFFYQQLLLLWHTDPARLRRYLCDSPRKRTQQAAHARLFIRSLSLVNVLPSLS